MPVYKYTPLDHQARTTRLLSLLPGVEADEIHVSLRTIHLFDDTPRFEALSYTWGSTDDLVQIMITDQLHNTSRGHLAVTQNLAVALRHLRSVDLKRDLWIDAICVDQQNLEERGQQVERMGEIYRKAQQVLVWLGPASTDSILAIDTLRRLASKVEVDWRSKSLKLPKTSDRVEFPPEWQIDTTSDNDAWSSIITFLERPWFKRLWIWQEVLLAKTAVLQCGYDKLDWEDYRKAVMALQLTFTGSNPQTDVEQRYTFSLWYSYCLVSNPALKTNLAGLVEYTKHCQCLDPRDRIYALLSILHPSDPTVGLKPDYTQETHHVYEKVVLRRLYRQDLTALTSCNFQNDLSTRPSWVPDWSKPRLSSPVPFARASLGCIARAQASDAGLLRATGCLAAVISHTEDHFVSTRSLFDDAIQRLFDRVRNYRPLATDSEIMSALCSTLCMDCFADSFIPEAELFPSFNTCLNHLLSDLPQGTKGFAAFSAQMQHCIRGRLFFTTNDGSIGSAPQAAKPGDHICVLLGCQSPLVIRQNPNGNHTIMGECYLHGMMEGQALMGPLSDEWKPVLIYAGGIDDHKHGYVNRETGEERFEDPRLGQLPLGWTSNDPDSKSDGLDWFINDEIGELVPWGSDPRMTPEALKARGVPLQDFVFE